MHINKITITTTSGYCPVVYMYKDRLTITETGLRYSCTPQIESETNPAHKWSYSTDSAEYREKYEELAKVVADVFQQKIDDFACDVGIVDFRIVYEDNSKDRRTFSLPINYFAGVFDILAQMVPACEVYPKE
ncbi:MAG: hypothetical protein IJU59_05820 [Firmicutes bacterium]|nr:hypothetical protein [Bacillota bacterium]